MTGPLTEEQLRDVIVTAINDSDPAMRGSAIYEAALAQAAARLALEMAAQECEEVCAGYIVEDKLPLHMWCAKGDAADECAAAIRALKGTSDE